METEQILDTHLQEPQKRRRALLPLWIKVFTWIFLVFGAVVPIALVLGILGINFNLSLFGLETTQVFSIIGIIIVLLFAIKGITAWGLWTEKDWAITIGQTDAIISIIICVVGTFIDTSGGFKLTVRLELIPLIPYLIKLNKIKKLW